MENYKLNRYPEQLLVLYFSLTQISEDDINQTKKSKIFLINHTCQ